MPASEIIEPISASATRIGWRATSISTPPASAAAAKKYSSRVSRLMARPRAARAGHGVGLGDVLRRLPVEQLVLREPHAAAVEAGQVGRLLHHADRVLRAGLDAQPAEHAARVVDLEARRVLRVRGVVRVEGGVDLDAPAPGRPWRTCCTRRTAGGRRGAA